MTKKEEPKKFPPFAKLFITTMDDEDWMWMMSEEDGPHHFGIWATFLMTAVRQQNDGVFTMPIKILSRCLKLDSEQILKSLPILHKFGWISWNPDTFKITIKNFKKYNPVHSSNWGGKRKGAGNPDWKKTSDDDYQDESQVRNETLSSRKAPYNYSYNYESSNEDSLPNPSHEGKRTSKIEDNGKYDPLDIAICETYPIPVSTIKNAGTEKERRFINRNIIRRIKDAADIIGSKEKLLASVKNYNEATKQMSDKTFIPTLNNWLDREYYLNPETWVREKKKTNEVEAKRDKTIEIGLGRRRLPDLE